MNETYHGYVRTPADAIKLFEACRVGLLPRVQRRLSEKERTAIRSGSVFVWDEREAGMRRWTDGKSWSASRVSGSFLTYREMEGKRTGGMGNQKRNNRRTPDSGSNDDHDDGEPEGYRYKADGLLKQSFSIVTVNKQHLHLISYYCRPGPGEPELKQPSKDPSLRHIQPPKGLYPESSMGETNPTPAMTRAPMQQTQVPYTHNYPGHNHSHAAPYSQGYGVPLSPMSTPPYGAQYSFYIHAAPPAPAQERTRLPPLPAPRERDSQRHDTPRDFQLQATAQAAAAPYPNEGGALPPLLNISNGPPQAIKTPPSRHLSVSPPRIGEPASPKFRGLPPPEPRGAGGVDFMAKRLLDQKFCL